MEITSEYLKTLYDVANKVFYQYEELPDMPIIANTQGVTEFGAVTHCVRKPSGEWLPDHMTVNIDGAARRRWSEEGIGPLTYSADLVAAMLHEMVHVYFIVTGRAGKDGGLRAGTTHTVEYAAEAVTHGLCVYVDGNSLDVDQYIEPRTAHYFESYGIKIVGMGRQWEGERHC